MGQFSKWLLHEDQKEFFDYVFAIVLAIISFIVFSVWPAAGTAFYGWFFDLFW